MVPIYWKNTGLRVSSKVGSKVLKSGFQVREVVTRYGTVGSKAMGN